MLLTELSKGGLALAHNAIRYGHGEGKEEARLIYGAPSFEAANFELEYVLGLRPDLPNPVLHFSVPFHPGDRAMPDNEMAQAVLDVFDALGYRNCPKIITRHFDTDHDHVHVVTTRFGFDGKRVERSQELEHAGRLCRAQEIKLGLHRIQPLDPQHPLRRNHSVVLPPLEAGLPELPVPEVGLLDTGGKLLLQGLKVEHTLRGLMAHMERQGYQIKPMFEASGKLKTVHLCAPGSGSWHSLSKFKELSIAKMIKTHGLKPIAAEDLAWIGQRMPAVAPTRRPVFMPPPAVQTLPPPAVVMLPAPGVAMLPPPVQLLSQPAVPLLPAYRPAAHQAALPEGSRVKRSPLIEALFRAFEFFRRPFRSVLTPGVVHVPSAGKHRLG